MSPVGRHRVRFLLLTPVNVEGIGIGVREQWKV